MRHSFQIDHRLVGMDYQPLVVVELGINHSGSLETAMNLVKEAHLHGAEVIKHQTHIPDSEMSLEARHVKPGNSNSSIYDVVSMNSLTLDEERQLAAFVRSLGMIYLSTPFSFDAVDFLEDLKVSAYKIGSGECNNYPLVKYIAERGKPVILSTGMNSIESIRTSVEILEHADVPYALLQCTNLYPTPTHLLNIQAIADIKQNFPNAILGLSDHSKTIYPCIAAITLGASIVEKHFTDTRTRIGPDIPCSMTPSELRELIHATNIVHQSMGSGKVKLLEEEVTRKFAFASVVAKKNIVPGEVLSRDNITLKRPSGGDFGPEDFESLFGLICESQIPENTQLRHQQVQKLQ